MRLFAVCLLAWTLVGLIYFAQDVTRRFYFDDPLPWREAGYWTVRVLLSAALTPAILWLGRRWPLQRGAWIPRTGLHLLFGAGFAVLEVTLETAILALLGTWSAPTRRAAFEHWLPILLIFGFHNGFIAYWVVLGIQSGLRYYRQYMDRAQHALRLELHTSELKSQLAHAQLSALKMQLHPHFLFNTLNAIIVLVRQQKADQAEATLARFSDLLRLVLSDLNAEEVPLRRELEYVRLYLSIEELRFSDRFRYTISAVPQVLDAVVPHMALQPLVENAVRHGIERHAGAGGIGLYAERVRDTLRITVANDGPGLPAATAAPGHGIGLANTRARLKQLYAERATLHISSRDRGTVVTMIVPYRAHSPQPEDDLIGGFIDAPGTQRRSVDRVGR